MIKGFQQRHDNAETKSWETKDVLDMSRVHAKYRQYQKYTNGIAVKPPAFKPEKRVTAAARGTTTGISGNTTTATQKPVFFGFLTEIARKITFFIHFTGDLPSDVALLSPCLFDSEERCLNSTSGVVKS